MSDMTDHNAILEALSALHGAVETAVAAFTEMQRHAEPEIEALVSDLAALHTAHESALAELLVQRGRQPDEDLSVSPAVQRLVVKTRSLFDDLDTDALDSIAEDEAGIVRLYDDVLSKGASPAENAVLLDQRARLMAQIDRTRAMIET